MIDYSDYVRVRSGAPHRYQPGRQGSVASVFVLETERHGLSFSEPIGTRMIGVKTEDGSLLEVPEQHIEKLA